MKLHIVDILIICAYLMVIVAIGLFLKKKALTPKLPTVK